MLPNKKVKNKIVSRDDRRTHSFQKVDWHGQWLRQFTVASVLPTHS